MSSYFTKFFTPNPRQLSTPQAGAGAEVGWQAAAGLPALSGAESTTDGARQAGGVPWRELASVAYDTKFSRSPFLLLYNDIVSPSSTLAYTIPLSSGTFLLTCL